MKVEFTDDAREQVRIAAGWWRENRLIAPSLFEDELAAAVSLLESGPLLARVFDEVEGSVALRTDPRGALALVAIG